MSSTSLNHQQLLPSLNSKKYIEQIKSLLSIKYSSILQNSPAPCSILQQALEYTILSNGKHLRAALLFAFCSDPHGDMITNKLNPLLLNSACAIELVHTYSIVHDDLPAMDDDDYRRGKPSCHIQFDEATAILVGDCLQSLAFELLSDLDYNPKQQLQIIKILSQAIGHQGMVAGQSIELNQEKNSNTKPNITQLNQIHLLKTGKLFTACLQIGAIISNLAQNQEQYSLITTLGEKLGLAFQIQDDILDNTKSSIELGKPALSDAKRNLDTYSNIIGLNQAQVILNELWNDCYLIINQLEINKEVLSGLVYFIQSRQN